MCIFNNTMYCGLITFALTIFSASADTITNGLIAYYPLDGNSADYSGYSNNPMQSYDLNESFPNRFNGYGELLIALNPDNPSLGPIPMYASPKGLIPVGGINFPAFTLSFWYYEQGGSHGNSM